MRVSEALDIARKSVNDLKARLESISIKDHYSLLKDLQHTNSPDVFNTALSSLHKKLSHFWKGIKGIKITNENGADNLREIIHTKTGLDLDDNTSPHESFKAFMNEVADMRM